MRTLLYLRELLKRERIDHYLKLFRVSERLSADELRKFQSEKLRELLLYLKQFNPYYSEYIKDHNIQLDRRLGDEPYNTLKELPMVDKQFIMKYKKQWLTLNKNAKLNISITSGSTGMPLELYHSSVSRDVKTASKCRLLAWHGVKRWEKQLYYGSIFHLDESKLIAIKVHLNDKFVWNKIIIDATKINNNNIEMEITRINKLKPTTIWGYPSIIFEIARHSIQNNLPIENEKLRMVIFSGESYTTYMKSIVRQAFNIEPDDEYNSTEGFIAGTCEYNNLHLNEDILIAEILDSEGKVSEYGKGELLVTQLYSYDFPFIRYNIGDIVEITDDKCKCGRNFKVLKAVDGRTSSVIYNGEEKILNEACNTYMTAFIGVNAYKKYQFIQNDISNLIIKLVVSDTTLDYSKFESEIKQLFDKLDVKFEYVDDISRDKSGKYRGVISNINR